MATQADLEAAIAGIEEPELRKTLGELALIRSVTVEGDRATIVLGQPIPDSPAREELEIALRERLAAFADIDRIDITFEPFSAEEQAALKQKLTGGRLQSPLLTGESDAEIIAVASGKGGVGKSTISVNLAVALAEKGYRVGIMDCDIYGFSVPGLLGVDRDPSVLDDMVIPVPKHGVGVMSMEFFLEENRPVIWRGPMLGKMLMQFFQRVYWGDLDFLVLDLPPGTGDMALNIHEMLPVTRELVVTTPHQTAADVAYRAGRMAEFTRKEHELLGVIENMAYYRDEETGRVLHIFGEGGGAWVAEKLGIPLVAQVPLGNPTRPGTGLFEQGTEAYQAIEKVVAVCEDVLRRERAKRAQRQA